MNTKKYFVIIPNHLPHLNFLDGWMTEFDMDQTQVIVVQDFGKKPGGIPGPTTVYDREDIACWLADMANMNATWIFPQRTSACRSFGYLAAWRLWVEQGRDPDTIFLTLDNDCYPERPDYWLAGHRAMLDSPVTLDWVNTMGETHARGFPYEIRGASPVMLNHGLWSNVPDLDGPTMLLKPDLRLPPVSEGASMKIPRWSFFPMCGMNLAWRPELTPALYFGLFGPDYGFDQFDDIWAGVLVKKVLDHLGYGVRSGYPSVEHRKQSNAFINLTKQAPGMAFNEDFWHIVQDIQLPPAERNLAGVIEEHGTRHAREVSIMQVYRDLITALPDNATRCPVLPAGGASAGPLAPGRPWLATFKEAALLWLDLFQS